MPLILLQVTTAPSLAQVTDGPQHKNNIQLHYGFVHSRLIDDGYSKNLLFRGTNSKLALLYERRIGKYSLLFSVEGSGGKVRSKHEKLPSDFYTAGPSLQLLKHVRDFRLLGFFAGAGASSLNYFILNEPVFDNASLLSLHGAYVNAGTRISLHHGDHVELTYWLPVVVFANRLLWNGGASELSHRDLDHIFRTLTTRGSFSYFDVLNNVQLTADYDRPLGHKVDLVASYKFRYVSYDPGSRVGIYTNELLFGLKFHF